MAPLRLFFLVAFFCLVEAAWFKRRKGKIYDPLGVFCGEENCYDVLNVTSTFEPQELKTKFRRLSRTYHPDKNKAENATQIFRTIAKAYEVLGNNKSRDSFDYYLRTKDYYTVAGEYVRSMPLPKPPPLAILVVVLILMSIFLHVVQNNKNARAKRILRDRVLNAKDEYNGGTKQTLAVFATAKELYLEQLEAKVAGVAAGGTDAAAASKKERKLAEKKMKKNGGTVQVPLPKLLADPAFQQIAINLIDGLVIEGDYAKPELKDLLIFRVLKLPYSLCLYLLKYYRRHISNVPLSQEEKSEMTIEAVGLATWEDLTPIQQTELVERQVWKPNEYDKFIAERAQNPRLQKKWTKEAEREEAEHPHIE